MFEKPRATDLRVPESLLDRADAVAKARFGDKTKRLGRAIAEMSVRYTHERESLASARGDKRFLLARLAFYLPRDVLKAALPLEELRLRGALPAGPRWRVLDLGAGLGTTTLSAAWIAARAGVERVEAHAYDADPEALAIAKEMAGPKLDGLAAIDLRAARGSIADALTGASGPFDLITFGLVLNEAAAEPAEMATLLRRALEMLSPEGVLLVVEPALHAPARALQEARDRLVQDGLGDRILGPCTHARPCPLLAGPRDWCHAEWRAPLPERVAARAREAGLRDEKSTFTWLALGPASASPLPLGAARLVSKALRSKGKIERDVCGDHEALRHMRLDRQASDDNDAFEDLPRGALVRVEGATPKGARMRVTDETRVEAWPPRED